VVEDDSWYCGIQYRYSGLPGLHAGNILSLYPQFLFLVRVRGLAREVVAGVIGGVIGAGLMKIRAPPPPPPAITASKQVIQPQSITAGASVTLKPTTTYKFTIILFHGNGDPQVRIDVIKGAVTETLRGNEQAIEVLANESITIVAVNEDTATARNTPTIEIVSLSW
jgi:hypothetical protein